MDKIVPDKRLSIYAGAIAPLGKHKSTTIFWQIEAILEKYGLNLKTPVAEIPDEAMDEIMNGTDEHLNIKNQTIGTNYFLSYDGILKYIEIQSDNSASASEQKWANQYSKEIKCPECNGQRLRRESLHFRIHDKNIAELAALDISQLHEWLSGVEAFMNEKQKTIATEILKEIRTRLQFLLDVGLNYLSLNRSSQSLRCESQRIRLATQIGSQLVNYSTFSRTKHRSASARQRKAYPFAQAIARHRQLGNCGGTRQGHDARCRLCGRFGSARRSSWR
jgi:excinuclease ABC subunit A